jgi:hypothetical protein
MFVREDKFRTKRLMLMSAILFVALMNPFYLRNLSTFPLTLVDDSAGEVRTDGRTSCWLGPPAGLRFLALRPISANLKIGLAPRPGATTFPIDFFLADDQGHVSQGEIRGETIESGG